MRARGRFAQALVTLAAVTVLGACRRPPPSTDQTCEGQPPECFRPTGDGCCAEQPVPAECGPKDAPLGTHLKWICADPSVVRSECRALGAACAPTAPERPAEVIAPHAAVELQVYDPDASASDLADAAPEAGTKRPKRGRRGR